MISIVLALLTAASNASASVLQRRAASQTKATKQLGGFSLLRDLARRKVWLAGIGMVIVASLFQAGALATGPIALVQPIFIVELPLTLLLSSWVWHRRLAPRTWAAVALVTVSLGAGLTAAQPSGGGNSASTGIWILTLIATVGFMGLLIGAGVRFSGEPRAALLGLAAACGYALTAALLKEAVAALDHGIVAFFETWQLYGVAVAGVGSLILLQNALQVGTLAASQPSLTVGDALLSTVYGVIALPRDPAAGLVADPGDRLPGADRGRLHRDRQVAGGHGARRDILAVSAGRCGGCGRGQPARQRAAGRRRDRAPGRPGPVGPGLARDLVVGQPGVQVHVVPAVHMQQVAALGALVAEARLVRDAAGRRVQGRVVQLDPVQAHRLEHPD